MGRERSLSPYALTPALSQREREFYLQLRRRRPPTGPPAAHTRKLQMISVNVLPKAGCALCFQLVNSGLQPALEPGLQFRLIILLLQIFNGHARLIQRNEV